MYAYHQGTNQTTAETCQTPYSMKGSHNGFAIQMFYPNGLCVHRDTIHIAAHAEKG
jgi:hypothetical protein